MAKKQSSNTLKDKKNKKSDIVNLKDPVSTSKQTSKQSETQKSSKSTEQKQTSVGLTHEQISERAKAIWQQRGCPADKDMDNWLEAEKELKSEYAIH
jgi:hypothetical protein